MKLFKNQHILFWLFLAMLILPNLFMFFTESTGLLTRVVNIILPLGAFWLAMTLKAKPGHMFWWLFFFHFVAAFQIVLLYLFGESPIAVDMFLNVITTNPTEVGELLSQLLPSVIFVIVVYGTGIALSIVSIRNRATLREAFRHNQRIIGGALLVIGLILLGVNCLKDKRFRIQDDIFPINGTYNFLLAFERAYQSANYSKTSADFKHDAVLVRRDSVPEVYVLVIGETLFADHMALYGYDRPTTPHLQGDSIARSLVFYRDAITMSNTTHKSVPLLLTPVASQGDYDSLYCERGLISAFQEAGFKTSFYSNQRRNGSFIDFLGCEAQDIHFIKDSLPLTANPYDEELFTLLDRRLKAQPTQPLLIVLHCYGSHFEYRDRYPATRQVFGDTDYPTAERKYRQQLVNAYDNTVAYADYVLSRVMATLDASGRRAVMLYTSDHGEDIFDDSRGRFLHASPIPTYYQLRVPFIAWATDSWRQAHPAQWQTLAGNSQKPISTNMVMYHTLLDMAGIRTRLLRPDLALDNAAFKPVQRLYVNDHNDLRTLDNCGLKPLDIDQFNRHRLQFP